MTCNWRVQLRCCNEVPQSPRGMSPGVGLLALGVLLAAHPGHVYGQDLAIGARGGATLAAMLWQDPYAADQTAIQSGAHVGLVAAWRIADHAAIQAELLYTRKGYADGGAHTGTVAADYVEVPVLLTLRLPWRTTPRLLFGPMVSVETRCRLSGVVIVGETACGDSLVGMARRRLDVGVMTGAGVARDIGERSVALDLIAGIGLRDIKAEPLPPGYARNVVLYASVTVLRPFPGREDP